MFDGGENYSVPEVPTPETDIPEVPTPETETSETDIPETDIPEIDIPELYAFKSELDSLSDQVKGINPDPDGDIESSNMA